MTASSSGEHAVFPDVAMNPDGAGIVAWYNGAAGVTEAALVTPDGELSAPLIVSKDGEFGGWPAVAMDSAGNAVVVFTGGSYDNPPEENGVKAALVSPHGKVEGPFTVGTSTTGSIGSTGVGMDAAGDAIAWWQASVSENRLKYAYKPSGGRFGEPVSIPNPASHLSRPTLAMAANGDAVATWASRTQVYAAIRQAGGDFAPAEALSAPVTAAAIQPRLAMAPDGSAVVAWVDRLDDRGNGFVRAAYRPPGGTFSPPRTLAEVFYTGVYDVSVAMSPAGEALVMWAGGTWVPRTDWFTTYVTRRPGGDFGAPREAYRIGCYEPPQAAYDAAENVYAACRHYYGQDELYQPLGVAYGAVRPAGRSFGAPTALTPGGQNVWPVAVAAGPPGHAIAAWPRGWFPYPFHVEVARHSGSVIGPPADLQHGGGPGPVPPRSPATGAVKPPRTRPARLLESVAASLAARERLGRQLARGAVRLRLRMPAPGALGIRVLTAGKRAVLVARGRVVFGRGKPVTLVVRATEAGRRVLARKAPLVAALTLHLAAEARTRARLRLR